MIYILPYKRYSKSAKELRTLLKCRVKREHIKPFNNQFIVNWGNNNFHPGDNCTVINHPKAVRIASNKLLALKKMRDEGVATCDFTINPEVVEQWLAKGYKTVARTLLRANSGKGIVIIREGERVINAPLYTKYHKKTNEFRVHIFDGKVIDYVEKKKRLDTNDDTFNSLIRSYENGWVFCRDGILVREDVKKEAIKAVKALGLDFGAVDVILSKDKPLVLEVNTAPGLVETTLHNYAKAIKQLRDEYVQSW